MYSVVIAHIAVLKEGEIILLPALKPICLAKYETVIRQTINCFQKQCVA